MTGLTKPVSRSTVLLLDNRINSRNRDQITVTLYPNNTIGFRAYKCRKEVRLDLSVAYQAALIQEAKGLRRQYEIECRAQGKRPRKIKRGSSLLF